MKINKVKITQDITRWLIASVYIISGISKAFDSLSFAQLLKSYGFGIVQWGAPFIAFIEVVLGLLLIFNYRKQLVAGLIGIMTIGFSLAFAYAYHFKGVTDCGCMGFLTQTPASVSFIRNILIIGGSVWIWRWPADVQDRVLVPWKQRVLITLCFGTFGLALILMANRSYRHTTCRWAILLKNHSSATIKTDFLTTINMGLYSFSLPIAIIAGIQQPI